MKDLRRCKACETDNPPEALFCSGCGEDFNSRTSDVLDSSETPTRELPDLNRLGTAEDELLGQRISHFKVDAALGAGGMGRVYLARDLELGRQVALKFLSEQLTNSPDARARFLREARSASALDHPNIGTIFEAGEHGDVLFIAMAYYDGETLRERMRRGPLSPGEAISLVRQMAAGLAAAHEAGIVHRDIKPENAMLTPEGQIKILDFGLAKPGPAGGDSAAELTATGTTLGTVGYMSPEQARGEPVDHRTDLWSLGVVAYELLAGKQPFATQETVATLSRILTEPPPPLDGRGLPSDLVDLVFCLLQKDRDRRIQSAREIEQMLRALEAGDGASTIQRPTPSREAPVEGGGGTAGRDRDKRRPVLATLVVALLAVVAGLTGWKWLAAPDAPPAIKSILALPCQVLGSNEVAFLADAVPATLTTALSQVEGLETRLPPTSLQVDASRPDMKRLAEAYGVGICLTCSVVADAEQLVLNFQAVEPLTQRVLWSRHFEGARDDYMAVLRDVAGGVVLAMVPDTKALPEGLMAGARSAAEEEFQRGKYYVNLYNHRRNAQDFDTAVEALESSLTLDPSLAEAEAQIGFLYFVRPDTDWSSVTEDYARAALQAEKALTLDPDNAMAWSVKSGLEHFRGEPALGVEYGLRSLQLDPRSGYHYTNLLPLNSVWGVDFMLEGDRIDPLYYYNKANAAVTYALLGNWDQALRLSDQVLEAEPNMSGALFVKYWILVSRGRHDEASQIAEQWVAATGDPVGIGTPNPLVWALEYQSEETQRDFEARYLTMIADPETTPKLAGDVAVFGAMTLIPYDRYDPALQFLLAAVHRSPALVPYDWLRLSPVLDPIRSEPEFAKLLELSRPVFMETLAVLEAAQARGELPDFMQQPLVDVKEQMGI